MSSQDLFDTIPAFLPQNRKILVAASAALHSANRFTYSINVKIPHFLPSWVIVARKLDLWPQVQGHLDLNSKISNRCTCGITLSWVIAFTTWVSKKHVSNTSYQTVCSEASIVSPGPACDRSPGDLQQLLHKGGCICFGPPSKSWGPSHQL